MLLWMKITFRKAMFMNDIKAVVLAQEYIKAHHTDMFKEYKDIVSVKEASIMLNTGRKQIYKLIKQGKLDKLEHNAKGFLITKRSIVAYVLNTSEVSA